MKRRRRDDRIIKLSVFFFNYILFILNIQIARGKGKYSWEKNAPVIHGILSLIKSLPKVYTVMIK